MILIYLLMSIVPLCEFAVLVVCLPNLSCCGAFLPLRRYIRLYRTILC